MGRFGCKSSQDRVGVLLAQLGTPDAPTAPALRRYLKQFLSDPRVIEKNRILWWLILNCIILRFRPAKSAALYARIWQPGGSPLSITTARQRELLAKSFAGSDLVVEYGMRYGSPSLESAIDRMISQGVKRILLVPMYPQYSAATTASTYDAVFPALLKQRWVPTLKVASPFYNHPAFIRAQAKIIDKHFNSISPAPERLILSYHGVPKEYVTKGDPYCCMCTETSRALTEKLSIPNEKIIHTFQSRFGRDPWLTPYTDETIEQLAKDGVKRIAVACPGFTTDCLETLDELGNEAGHAFREAGGESLSLIPCLNDSPEWIDALSEIVREEIGSWVNSSPDSCVSCPAQCAAS